MAKNISLLACRTPVQLEFFLQFSFANIVFMFFLHYLCRIIRSINSTKAFKFLSKRLVLLLYGNQYRHLYCTQNNVFVIDEESRGWGSVSLCVPGGGEQTTKWDKNCKSPGVCQGEEMVTGRIEPCIN